MCGKVLSVVRENKATQRGEVREAGTPGGPSPWFQLFLTLHPRSPAVWLLKLALDSGGNTIPFMAQLV